MHKVKYGEYKNPMIKCAPWKKNWNAFWTFGYWTAVETSDFLGKGVKGTPHCYCFLSFPVAWAVYQGALSSVVWTDEQFYTILKGKGEMYNSSTQSATTI